MVRISKEVLRDYGFVARSPNRRKVLLELVNGPQIPTYIGKKLNLNINHVSRALAELKSVNLVICINPDQKKGRVYSLTQKGKEVAKNFIKVSQIPITK